MAQVTPQSFGWRVKLGSVAQCSSLELLGNGEIPDQTAFDPPLPIFGFFIEFFFAKIQKYSLIYVNLP